MDQSDDEHEACLDLLDSHPGPLIVPQLAVAEVAHFLHRRMGVRDEVRFIADFAAGNYIPEPVALGDWVRIAELLTQYADLTIGIVDASVVAAAERLGITQIATLDRRHFSVVRPAHTDSFELLP